MSQVHRPATQVVADVPVVSVVVPVFNEKPEVLCTSMASIQGQTLTAFECLIVDESTNPETRQACDRIAAQDSRFRVLRPPQRIGLAGSLNLGIRSARGRYLARHDGDDVSTVRRLETQVAFLDAHPEIAVVGGSMVITDRAGQVTHRRRYALEHLRIARAMQLVNAMAHPTVMARRDVIMEVGGYRADFRYCEDLELWLRLMNAGYRFANLREELVTYRQDSFTRPPSNWRYNLKARWINFRTAHLGLRLLGLCVVGLFAAFPTGLQAALYRRGVLRSRDGGVENPRRAA